MPRCPVDVRTAYSNNMYTVHQFKSLLQNYENVYHGKDVWLTMHSCMHIILYKHVHHFECPTVCHYMHMARNMRHSFIINLK